MKKKLVLICILFMPLFFMLGCAEIISLAFESTRVPDSRFIGTWTYNDEGKYYFYKFDDDGNTGSNGSYVIKKVITPRPPYMGGDYDSYERRYGPTYDFIWKEEDGKYYKGYGNNSFNLRYIDSNQIKINGDTYTKT